MATWLEKLRNIDQRNKEQEKLAREMTHRPQADIESLRGQDPMTDWALGMRERTLNPLATLAGEAKRFQGLSPQEMGMELIGGGMSGTISKAINKFSPSYDFETLNSMKNRLSELSSGKDIGVIPREEWKAANKQVKEYERNLYSSQKQDLSLTPKQLIEKPEYGLQHRPPSKDFGAPLHDLTGGGGIYPSDIYSSKAIQYYGTGNDNLDKQTLKIINQYKDNPDRQVTIYRAVPKDVPENATINAGDWVTVNPEYAKYHGDSVLSGDYKILKTKVPAKSIYTSGDSIHEFGYNP